MIQEGSVRLDIDTGKITRKLDVFYNPVMKLNRDTSVLLLNNLPDKNIQVALPLAGSGIRGMRFLKEVASIKHVWFNDHASAPDIQRNLSLNNIDPKKTTVTGKDANIFLLESKGFDYIDIDPFGTPNPFLQAAISRLSRQGILAVTATDTAALAGSSPNACRRKYWAEPMKNEMMHEIGLRILIRKVQLMGMHNNRALRPIFSYAKHHYYRVFFRSDKGKRKADAIFKEHRYFLYNPKTMERQVSISNSREGYASAGPLWAGKLWDEDLVSKMHEDAQGKARDLLDMIVQEAGVDVVGFYDLHKLAQTYDKDIPKIKDMLGEATKRTHFLNWGVKSTFSAKELLSLI